MMPVRPPIRNIDRKPKANSIGEANRIRPPYIVASQLKNLMPVGIETKQAGRGEEQVQRPAHADGEHVMCPDAQADEGDGHRRGRHELVAEQHLARKDRDHLARSCRRPAESGCKPRGGRRTRTGAATDRPSRRLRVEEMRPQLRSSSIMTSAAVSGGIDQEICTEVQSIVQTKNGTLRERHAGCPHRQRSWRRS